MWYLDAVYFLGLPALAGYESELREECHTVSVPADFRRLVQ